MKKISKIMLVMTTCAAIFGFMGCKVTLTPLPEYTITYVTEFGNQPESKTVKSGYILTAEDLPNFEDLDKYYFDSWDKEVGDVITADTTITGKWEKIVYLKCKPGNEYFINYIFNGTPADYNVKEVVITKEKYDGTEEPKAAATGEDPNYFSAYAVPLTGEDEGKYKVIVSGNGHRIYAPEDINSLFYDNSALESIDLRGLTTSKVTCMDFMFEACTNLVSVDVSSFDTSNVLSIEAMFAGDTKLKELNVSNFNTSKVTTTSRMFEHCETLTSLDISNFDFSQVTDMTYMFYCDTKLNSLTLPSNCTATNLTNANNMFENCKALKSIDLSFMDLTNKITFSDMFAKCDAIETIKVSESSYEIFKAIFPDLESKFIK